MKIIFGKTSAVTIMTIILLIGCFYFSKNIYDSYINGDVLNNVQDTITSIDIQQEQKGFPMRLKIPSIHVDTSIDAVGSTPDGAMEVSEDYKKTSWFALGTIPGKEGSAVIGGHHGTKNNIGVFYNLSKLRKGDMIYIENDEGESISFAMRESHVYDFEANTKDIFTSVSGIHLNLITCIGDRDNVKKIYTNRLVVFADIVEQ